MGWSIGFDSNWNRDIGYGVPCYCDHPECNENIDRGLSYVCGSEPYGGADGCGLYFCEKHRETFDADEYPSLELDGDYASLCERCSAQGESFEAKPDHPDWIEWKLNHESWSDWRQENPDQVNEMKTQLTNPE